MIDAPEKSKRDRMSQKLQRVLRHLIIMLHDAFCGAFSYWSAAAIILPLHQFAADVSAIIPIAITAGILSVAISSILGVFSARWRLASLTDFVTLIKSATVLMTVLFVLRAIYHLNHSAPLIVAEMRIIVLGSIFVLGSQATGRIAFRYYHYLRRKGSARELSDITIFVGSASEAENALHAADQGTLNCNIVACLFHVGDPPGKQIRGRPVLGSSTDLELACKILAAGGQNVSSLILGSKFLVQSPASQHLKRLARRLRLTLLKIEAVGLGRRSEIRFEDFLFRERRHLDQKLIRKFVAGKSFLITGGGGTIGGDIALLAASSGASKITLLDTAELGLQTRVAQLRRENSQAEIELVICDVRDRERMMKIVDQIRPDVLIHAAALKHVDLVEQNWEEATRTNVFGTLNALDAADSTNVPIFVNISTDKATDPVGMLGLTKRASEILVANRATTASNKRYSVRFGNVLGSSGSVLKIFLNQINAGGPITLTDKRVSRYFMSRDEAAELVLATGTLQAHSGLYVLDMGEPIGIQDLAIQMIEWAGLEPHKDISIIEKGLRAGERLAEKLISSDEHLHPTSVPGINIVRRDKPTATINLVLLAQALAQNNKMAAQNILICDENHEAEAPGLVMGNFNL